MSDVFCLTDRQTETTVLNLLISPEAEGGQIYLIFVKMPLVNTRQYQYTMFAMTN